MFVAKTRTETQRKTIDHQIAVKIQAIYEALEPFRLVPSPEEIAHLLLYRTFSGRCFMCLCRGYVGKLHIRDLVKDHCHDTGMVRSLLCRSCNSFEPHGYDSAWESYRKFYPASGWNYRYYDPFAPHLTPPVDQISNIRVTVDDLACLISNENNILKSDIDIEMLFEDQNEKLLNFLGEGSNLIKKYKELARGILDSNNSKAN